MGRKASAEHGFALLFVVSVLAVIAALATGFAIAAKRQIAMTRTTLDLAVAHARAEAGFSLALAGLLDSDNAARWRTDGRVRIVTFDGVEISVVLQNEAGKIDLNWAPTELIAGLLEEFGANAATTGQIIDGIRAKRQAGTLSENPRGEQATGLLLGGPTLRGLAAFPYRSVDELRAVPGMNAALFDQIAPFLTVYAESAHIDAITAPRAVLQAIPDISGTDVTAFLDARQEGSVIGPAVLAAMPDRMRAYAGGVEERAVTITATVKSGAHGRFIRHAVVALTGQPSAPYQILEWRQELQ